MKRIGMLVGALAVAGALCAQARVTERAPFETYRFIVDRKPFGDVAPRPPPLPPPVALTSALAPAPAALPPPAWLSSLKLVAIVLEKGQAPRVGLYDTKTKNSVFLYEGEAEEYLVVKVDYEGEKALLEKDGRRYWFRAEGAPYEDGAEPPPVQVGGPAAGVARPAAGPAASAASVAPGMTLGMPRARARAASRPALTTEEYEKIKHTLPPPESPALRAARAEGAAPPPMTPEQLERYLQEQQMELIRAQGELGPALPMPLTPEMDAQLVHEGVLSAQ